MYKSNKKAIYLSYIRICKLFFECLKAPNILNRVYRVKIPVSIIA